MIRVVIVDDMATVREMLRMVLESDPDIKVVGTAHGGKKAIDIIPQLKPDIVLMDLRMPDMDGFQTVRHIMAYFPTPILIVTSTYTERSKLLFQALESGALDLMKKPQAYLVEKDPEIAKELIQKVRALSVAKVNVVEEEHIKIRRRLRMHFTQGERKGKVVAIASSTGGPGALKEVLPLIPEDFPAGIVVIQHMSVGFMQGLVDWLQNLSKIKMRIAKEGDTIQPGVALFAPDSCHLICDKKGKMKFENSPPVGGIRPAADILFPSIAKFYGRQVIGVIMTGMGDDGARGMQLIKKEGGKVIAQDEESCAVFGMPKAAIDRGVVDKIVPLKEIPEAIIEFL